jgi:hypothetical protein
MANRQPTVTCVHCGRQAGSFHGGWAKVGTQPLCHPSEPGRPDCYHLATVYALTHPLHDCPRCTPQPAMAPEVSQALAKIAGTMNFTPASRELMFAQVPPGAQTVADLPEHLRLLLEKAQETP